MPAEQLPATPQNEHTYPHQQEWAQAGGVLTPDHVAADLQQNPSAYHPGLDPHLEANGIAVDRSAEQPDPMQSLEMAAVVNAEVQNTHNWEQIARDVPISPRHQAEHETLGASLDSSWQERSSTEQRALGTMAEIGRLGEDSAFGYWNDLNPNSWATTPLPEPKALKHQIGTRFLDNDMLGEREEHHELSVDLHNFGAVSRGSDMEAEIQVRGEAGRQNIPELIQDKMTKRRLGIFFGEDGKMKIKRSLEDEALAGPQKAVRELNKEMTAIAERADINDVVAFMDDRLSELRAETGNRGIAAGANFNMLMTGADLSPVTQNAQAAYMAERGLTEKTFGWQSWLKNAPKEQVANFAQWYVDRLETIADPAKREQFVRGQKDRYMEHIKNAVSAGWLNARHLKEAQKRVDDAKIVFFSPFGGVMTEFGAAAQPDRRKALVALPTITSDHITTHEFGHVFKSFDFKGMHKWRRKDHADEYKFDASNQLATVINEGFDEHMTIALMTGSPNVLSPEDRDAQHIPHAHGESELYTAYRDVFADLIKGDGVSESGDIDMGQVADAIPNFADFRALVASRWGGKDVLAEAFRIVDTIPNTHDIPQRVTEFLQTERAKAVAAHEMQRAA